MLVPRGYSGLKPNTRIVKDSRKKVKLFNVSEPVNHLETIMNQASLPTEKSLAMSASAVF